MLWLLPSPSPASWLPGAWPPPPLPLDDLPPLGLLVRFMEGIRSSVGCDSSLPPRERGGDFKAATAGWLPWFEVKEEDTSPCPAPPPPPLPLPIAAALTAELTEPTLKLEPRRLFGIVEEALTLPPSAAAAAAASTPSPSCWEACSMLAPQSLCSWSCANKAPDTRRRKSG